MKFFAYSALIASATAMGDEYYPKELNNDGMEAIQDCFSDSDCPEQYWPVGLDMSEFISYGPGACASFTRLG